MEQQQLDLVQTVALTLVCVNVALMATKTILEKVKDVTSTDLDNKAYAVVSKIADIGSKLVDWISGSVRR